jgi:hypothetical protein
MKKGRKAQNSAPSGPIKALRDCKIHFAVMKGSRAGDLL